MRTAEKEDFAANKVRSASMNKKTKTRTVRPEKSVDFEQKHRRKPSKVSSPRIMRAGTQAELQ